MPNTRSLARPISGPPVELAGTGRGRSTYRGLGFRRLGLLQPRFAGVQVKAPVLQESPLLLQGG